MNWNQINWKNFKKWSSISRDKKLQRSSVQEIKEAVSVSSLKNNTIPSKADLISKLRS